MIWMTWLGFFGMAGKYTALLCVSALGSRTRVALSFGHGFIFGLFWTAELGTAENRALTIDGSGRSVSTV